MALPQSWDALANGVHILEYDIPNVSAPKVTSGRLVIGSSLQGPKNSIVQITKSELRKAVYGSIDKKLESKGSYFHSTIDTLLNTGGVYALNVVPITGEKAQFFTLNSDAADSNGSTFLGDKGASNSIVQTNIEGRRFYNRTGLWYISDEELTRVKNTIATEGVKNKLISFANLSNKDVTIFVKQSDKGGFDVTAKVWYGNLGLEVPSYIHPDDYISDYMIQVIVVAGDWTNYAKLSSDVTFGSYFNESGLIISKINEFLSQKAVNVVAKVDGCVIPDFKDSVGNNISIDVAFNNLEAVTEMNIAIDDEMFTAYNLEADNFASGTPSTMRFDIVGHGVDAIDVPVANCINGDIAGSAQMIDALSYRGASKNTFDFKIVQGSILTSVNLVPSVNGATTTNKIVAYQDSNVYRAYLAGVFKTGDTNGAANRYIKTTAGEDSTGKFISIEAYSDVTFLTQESVNTFVDGADTFFNITTTKSDFTKEIPLVLAGFKNIAFEDNYDGSTTTKETTDILTESVNIDGTPTTITYMKAYENTKLYKMYADNQIRDGFECVDTISPTGPTVTIKITSPAPDSTGKFIEVRGYTALNVQTNLYQEMTVAPSVTSCTLKTLGYATVLKERSNKVTITITNATAGLENEGLSNSITNNAKKDRYLLADVDGVRSRMLKIKSVVKTIVDNTSHKIIITTDAPTVDSVLGISLSGITGTAVIPTLTVKQGIKNYFTTLNGFCLKKFVVGSGVDATMKSYPDGTMETQNSILKFMFDTNIAQTLVDTKLIDWRYVVDTYKGTIESNSKYWHAKLAAMKARAMAFVNMPSIKELEKSTTPSFVSTDSVNQGIFNFEYLKTGGNLDLNPSMTFSMASGAYNERDIATYLYPCFDSVGVKVDGNVTPRPWASFACNTVQRLFNGGNKFDGAMNETGVLSDPEVANIYTEYSSEAKVILQNLGYNYLVTNERGKPTIFSNCTAYNVTGSSLAKAHVRIGLIEIETYIEKLCFKYVGKKLTKVVQDEIETKINDYLKGLVQNGSIHAGVATILDVDNDADAKAAGGFVIDMALSFDPLAEKIINRYSVNPMGSDSLGFAIK